MKRIAIQHLKKHIGKEVAIAGWVDVRRDHGKLIFLDIRDGTGMVQCVVLPKGKLSNAEKEVVQKLRSEWVVKIGGVVNARPDNMVNSDTLNGDIELEIQSMSILNEAQELPFDKDTELNIDTYLDYMPLTLRSKKGKDIFKVQSEIMRAYRDTLITMDFVEFQAPKLVGNDAEGGANAFKVEYFYDKTAYLATSPQLYKQIMVGVFEKVFTVGNVFRAEKHSTTRHLNEYTSLDAEMGFIESHETVMDVLTKVIRSIVKAVGTACERELSSLKAASALCPTTFPVMKLRDAQTLIFKETGEDSTKEPDLSPAQEKWLCEYSAKEFKSDFIFITHYPASKRPFYTFEDENDAGYTKSFDLLFRGIEVATGGQRVHDYDTLVKKLKERGLNPDNFSFYLQTFQYGMPPHGGWGMGLERLTEKMLGLENIKEATLFPREMNRIDILLSD
ncbi:aspartate--tRNA(Asn) ligase [Candidatus Kaiserbacteria bacterium]|nr:aspartate--tRNA(Asn) ligase [Candidatus Kaiserbacteria bacterium]